VFKYKKPVELRFYGFFVAWKYQKDNDEIEELIKLLFFLVAGRKE
jgi:hypothetical protein